MKRLIIILLVIFGLCAPSLAMEWHTANQITAGWDAVTAANPADVIKYAVYTKILPNGEPTLLGEQDTLTAVITFDTEGRYIIGVSTVRYIDTGLPTEERLESVVNWSDTNGENTPNPFGARYFINPNPPKNLRKE